MAWDWIIFFGASAGLLAACILLIRLLDRRRRADPRDAVQSHTPVDWPENELDAIEYWQTRLMREAQRINHLPPPPP